MLKKLIKYDFKSTGKILIPLNLGLIFITIFGSILLGTEILQRDELALLSALLLMVYSLLLVATTFTTFIYLMVYYYRNLFTAQGYLTFTLPASSWSIFHSKLIVSTFWTLLNSILVFLSILALIGSAVGFSTLFEGISNMMIGEVIDLYGVTVTYSLPGIFGCSPAVFVIVLILFVVISSFYSVAVSHGSITIGQLYAKHKIVGSVLSFIGISILSSILSTIGMYAIIFFNMLPLMEMKTSEHVNVAYLLEQFQNLYTPMIPFHIILYLVISVICYIVSGIILKKKVNLD